jgi:EAL domain-containing protein (putative c-di-GMP-specific phosphodiesterase class I)
LPRSAAIDQIARQPNGSYVGIWGKYLLRCAFQPIFAFGQGRMDAVAYEGLIRPFENGKPVSPAEFFNSIGPLDRFGVETLTRNLHVLNSTLRIGETASLFLNFDPSVFIDRVISDAALRDLKLVLHESGIDHNRIVCELTEHKSGSDETLFDFVRALKANGFKIALDDYGADESDYARVKALQPQIIKFDGGWISRLMESQAGSALLKAMVSTFRDMGIKSLFEGLEETWQLDLAHECGVDMVQGFVLAVPELIPTDAPPVAAEPVSDLSVGRAFDAPTPVQAMPTASVAMRAARPFGRRGAAL